MIQWCSSDSSISLNTLPATYCSGHLWRWAWYLWSFRGSGWTSIIWTSFANIAVYAFLLLFGFVFSVLRRFLSLVERHPLFYPHFAGTMSGVIASLAFKVQADLSRHAFAFLTWRRESDVCDLYKNPKVPDCSLVQLSTCRCVGCESFQSLAGGVVCRIQCAQRSQLIARRGGSLLVFTSGGLRKTEDLPRNWTYPRPSRGKRLQPLKR